MKRTLVDFGVQLCDKDLEELCAFLVRCDDGKIVIGDLFNIIRPKLSAARTDLIEAVYRSIDSDADGCISLTDVMVWLRLCRLIIVAVITCSHRRHGQGNTVLSCLCRRCGHNWRQDKTVLSCLVTNCVHTTDTDKTDSFVLSVSAV